MGGGEGIVAATEFTLSVNTKAKNGLVLFDFEEEDKLQLLSTSIHYVFGTGLGLKNSTKINVQFLPGCSHHVLCGGWSKVRMFASSGAKG